MTRFDLNAAAEALLAEPPGQGFAAPEPPQPLPSELLPVPGLRPELLPAAVRAWCEDAAEGLQVPLDFTGIPAMVGLAAALGRTLALRMKRHDAWLEHPVLWGCVVGRPSTGKTPAISPTRRMLDRLEAEERERYACAARDHEAKVMIAEASRAQAREDVRRALKKGDRGAAQAAADAAMFEDEPPTEPRLVVNDATIEKFGELLNRNPRGLVLIRDELAGWLASLDREGREGDRAFWLEAWNGAGSFTVDRIGRGTIRIEACTASIMGGAQPGKVAEYVRQAVRGGFADDGLIQRFQLAVYPDLPASWRYSDRAPDPRAQAQAWEAFRRLRTLEPMAIGAEQPDGFELPFLRFDDEAQGLFIEWITGHMIRLRNADETPAVESHLAKYPSLVGRLALVLHLADGGTGPVPADVLATALDWTAYLEAHARRIYLRDNGAAGAHTLLRRKEALGDTFTLRDVYRRGWTGLDDPAAASAAVDVLIAHHHLVELPAEIGPGRPSPIYAWRAA